MAEPNRLAELSGVTEGAQIGKIRGLLRLLHRKNGHKRDEVPRSIPNLQPSPPLPEDTTVESTVGRNNRERSRGFEFELFTGAQIVNLEIPECSFLIKNLITERSVNMLAGEEGCGKSLLAMNLAIAVAGGASNWLSYEIAKNGPVLYLNNELAFSDFARRLQAMNLTPSLDLTQLVVPQEVPAILDCWGSLEQACRNLSPVLVIVDCLYFAHDEDENDSSSMKALMRRFLHLRDRYNLSVLLIHHLKKGVRDQRMRNDQMRGSSVFGGITDTVLQIRRSEDDETMRIMKPTKLRHVGDENRGCRLLSLNPTTFWFSDEGEVNEQEHLAQPAGPTARQQITPKHLFGEVTELALKDLLQRARPYEYNDRTIRRLLADWIEGGLVTKVKHGKYALVDEQFGETRRLVD